MCHFTAFGWRGVMRDADGRWQSTPKEPTPTPRAMARIAEAKQRNAARLERPSLEVKRISEKVTHTDITSDVAETLLNTFGTTSRDFVLAELSRLPSEQTEINAALAAIDGTRPENEMAAMLASQMVVTHGLAMDMLGRSKRVIWSSSGGLRRSGDQAPADIHDADRSPRQAQARRRTDGQG